MVLKDYVAQNHIKINRSNQVEQQATIRATKQSHTGHKVNIAYVEQLLSTDLDNTVFDEIFEEMPENLIT